MNALLILLLVLVAGIGMGCSEAPAHDVTVAEVRGECWTLLGRDAIRYAVHRAAGEKLGLKSGQRVTIHGVVAPRDRQNCAAAVVLDASLPAEAR